eukprot:9467931-Pyramimonas_sp.AAC.1
MPRKRCLTIAPHAELPLTCPDAPPVAHHHHPERPPSEPHPPAGADFTHLLLTPCKWPALVYLQEEPGSKTIAHRNNIMPPGGVHGTQWYMYRSILLCGAPYRAVPTRAVRSSKFGAQKQAAVHRCGCVGSSTSRGVGNVRANPHALCQVSGLILAVCNPHALCQVRICSPPRLLGLNMDAVKLTDETLRSHFIAREFNSLVNSLQTSYVCVEPFGPLARDLFMCYPLAGRSD